MPRKAAHILAALAVVGALLQAVPLVGAQSEQCDYGLDSTDALLVLQWEARLTIQPGCAIYLDINRDEQVNSVDASLILQYSAGLIDQL